MRTASRFLAVTGVVAFIALMGGPALAGQKGGGSEGGDRGSRALSNQSVRVSFLPIIEGRCLRLATAGVVTRNAEPAPPTTGGVITLPAGPTAANVVWAGLYWTVLDNVPPVHVNAVTLNGSPVTPVALPVTASPCWDETSAHAYFADVTGIVVAGANTVAGLDDSGLTGVAPESEGASLVVVYEDPRSTACQIIVTDGNDLTENGGDMWDNPLPVAAGPPPGGCEDTEARLFFIGGDGQFDYPDNQWWNFTPLGAGNDWDSSDPAAAGAFLNGWDTDGWAVVTAAPNTASIDAPIDSWDCVNWVATAIEIGVEPCLATPVEEGSWGQIKSIYR